MRILGLDYGDKTIGASISDDLLLTAQGLCTIRREDENALKKSVEKLSEIIRQYKVETIVLGYPKNMDNSEGVRCEKTLRFKEKLERNFKKVPVVLWDERLSTVGAERYLHDPALRTRKEAAGKKHGGLRHTQSNRYTEVIDEMAAMFILQGYLDALRLSEKTTEADVMKNERRKEQDE